MRKLIFLMILALFLTAIAGCPNPNRDRSNDASQINAAENAMD